MPEPIVSQIKYYRAVLDALVNRVENKTHSLTPQAQEGSDLDIHLKASTYQTQVAQKALEARMQLGNTLKYVSDEEDPYREATLDRICRKTEYIPDPVDRGEEKFHFPRFDTKVRTLDYIREVLDEMVSRLREEEDLDDEARIHLNDTISKISLCRNYCGKILHCIKELKEYESA